MGRRLLAAGGLTAGATLAVTGVAQADEFDVTNLDPSGSGSLAQAVDDANLHTGPDQIVFETSLSGTVALTGPLSIVSEVSITGPGASQVTVQGSGSDSIFLNDDAPFSISGLTLAGGSSEFGNGGAIRNNSGALTISNSVIRDSHADYFLDPDGPGAYGGAVFTDSGPVTIRSSRLTQNSSHYGGAIASITGSITVENSTLDHNDAFDGGGIYTFGQTPVTVTNSTIAENRADEGGGGIDLCCSQAAHSLKIRSSTITGNIAGDAGGGTAGGVSFATEDAHALLENSIVTGNEGAGDTADLYGGSNVFDTSFSLIGIPGDYVTGAVPGSNLYGLDPQLGALADNGGPTVTMSPASSSPVVNKGSAFGLTTDQRGLTRPVAFPGVANSTAAGADGSDIGAVELQAAQPNPAPVQPAVPHRKKCKRHKKKHKRSAESAKKKKKCKKKKKRK